MCKALTPKHPVVLTTLDVQESRCPLLTNISFQDSTPLESVMTTGTGYHLKQLKGTNLEHSEIWKQFMVSVLPVWLILITHFKNFSPTFKLELNTPLK